VEKALFDDATVLVGRPRHPLAIAKHPPTWKQLAQCAWVLPPHDSLLRQPLLVTFATHGVEPPTNFIETLSPNVTLNYLQGSDAIASLPASLARKYVENGALAILDVEPSRLVRPVGALWLRGHPPMDGDQVFMDALARAASELAAAE
jgi:DNA-binding transcriptional LysR family regulator